MCVYKVLQMREKVILYRIIRLFLLCIIFILVEPYWGTIKSQQNRDSIDYVLSQTKKISEKKEKLQALVKISKGKPDELYYLKRLLDISIQAGDRECYYKTLVSLADHYSYTNQLDSLMSCLSLADSTAREENEIPAALFDIQNHNLSISYY